MGAGGGVKSPVTLTPVVPVAKKTGNGAKASRLLKMVNKMQERIAERRHSVVRGAVGGPLNPILEETEDEKDDDDYDTEPELDLQQCQVYHPSYVHTEA